MPRLPNRSRTTLAAAGPKSASGSSAGVAMVSLAPITPCSAAHAAEFSLGRDKVDRYAIAGQRSKRKDGLDGPTPLPATTTCAHRRTPVERWWAMAPSLRRI